MVLWGDGRKGSERIFVSSGLSVGFSSLGGQTEEI